MLVTEMCIRDRDTTQAGPPKEQMEVKGQIAEDSKAVKALDEEDKAQEEMCIRDRSVYGLIHNRDDGSRLMRLPLGSLLSGTASQ